MKINSNILVIQIKKKNLVYFINARNVKSFT